jgi:hypothetical protein
MNDKRIRQLVIAVLLVILALGVVSLVSSLFQLIVPLAIVAALVFAFYKIVLQGRDQAEAMVDEVAETSGTLVEGAVSAAGAARAESGDESAAEGRLSAVEQARQEFFETNTPVEEILDQIQARKQRLQGGDNS